MLENYFSLNKYLLKKLLRETLLAVLELGTKSRLREKKFGLKIGHLQNEFCTPNLV